MREPQPNVCVHCADVSVFQAVLRAMRLQTKIDQYHSRSWKNRATLTVYAIHLLGGSGWEARGGPASMQSGKKINKWTRAVQNTRKFVRGENDIHNSKALQNITRMPKFEVGYTWKPTQVYETARAASRRKALMNSICVMVPSPFASMTCGEDVNRVGRQYASVTENMCT